MTHLLLPLPSKVTGAFNHREWSCHRVPHPVSSAQRTRPLISASISKTKKINGRLMCNIESSKATNSTLLHLGVLLTSIADEPAFAVTGSNNYEQDLTSVLIQSGAFAFFYFLIMPPIIMNWLRLRWYKRKLFETYLQFMFVFLFFPGILLWAPFINFRRLPRDPTMKHPWSTPRDSST
ncbi:hypothetical protein ZOSMA_137G00200 [Zostera marina]|uniref:NAD(P)H-quinone oxidoreductase subunit L n=1 Tax=Zostera marina TaxID=29655 RepID=A0A0K9Q0M5_ZOSMR|nr:hypothetical protein ZOSMA_137G00200 [Zostera marina]